MVNIYKTTTFSPYPQETESISNNLNIRLARAGEKIINRDT